LLLVFPGLLALVAEEEMVVVVMDVGAAEVQDLAQMVVVVEMVLMLLVLDALQEAAAAVA
jgi:hypothetical protein